MLNVLATSVQVMKLLLYYGACFAIILVAAIATICLKHQTKKEMRPTAVKKRCEKAKEYAKRSLTNKDKAKLFAAAKLVKLNGLVEEASWLAFQIFEKKRDIVFEGIANSLDGLATAISKEAYDGYLSVETYEECLNGAVKTLDGALEKLEEITKK